MKKIAVSVVAAAAALVVLTIAISSIIDLVDSSRLWHEVTDHPAS